MSNKTSNLDLLIQSQSAKEVTANALLDAASPAMLFGRRQSTTGGLVWGYYGGVMVIAGVFTRLDNGTITLPASATSYIEVTTAGVISSNTTGFTAGRSPLYKVITGASTITDYEDWRCYALKTL